MTGLSIADLMDGRRALVRTGSDRCEVVAVLSESDLRPVPWYQRQSSEVCQGLAAFDGDRFVGFVQTTQPLPIPPPPPKRRITADDLIKRGREQSPEPSLSPEEQSLRNINRLRGEDPEAPAKA
jgi:hypothetical protein